MQGVVHRPGRDLGRTVRRTLLVLSLPLSLLLTGCSLGGSSTTPPPPPVGIYKTTDRGDNWQTKNVVLNTNNPPGLTTLDNTNVVSLTFDPTDSSTLYLGSQSQGLYYTYNEAESWFTSRPIRSSAISVVAIPNDPNLRCTIYLATANQIFKSTDCGRHWTEAYQDSRANVRVLSLAMHQTNPQIVFAGLSTGDINKSTDGGLHWSTVARLNDAVMQIIPHALNENIFFAILAKNGVQKTTDGGTTWVDVSKGLAAFSGGKNIHDVTVDPNRPETMILATDYGLIQTTDGGVTWAALSLLTPPGKVKIYSVALDPEAPTNLYYTADTTFYRSSDAGKTWEAKPMPLTGVTSKILVDPQKSGTIYLAANRPTQASSTNSFGL